MRLRPASLRGRVVLGVLTLLALLLAALFVTVDVILSARLQSDLRTRLTDRVSLAEQLDGALTSQQLVDRLRGEGVSALLCTSTGSNATQCVQGDGAAPSPPAGNSPPSRGNAPTGRPAGPGRDGPPPKPAESSVQTAGDVLFVRTDLSSGQTLTLSVDSSQVGSTLRGLILLEVIGGLVALLLAALLLFRVVGVALRPLDHMTALAGRIAAGDRGRRLGTRSRDTELGRTATAFDAMLDELESAAATAAAAEARLRALLGDVSHELRSPLTGIAATTELLLREEPGRDEREAAYVTLVRETRRANRLLDDLLTMTRLDTGMTLATGPVDLVEVARHEADRLRTLAPDLDVAVIGAPEAAVTGDATRLGQIIGNLLGNARTAVGPRGRIEVSVTRDSDRWQLDVADDGAGVPVGAEHDIFERLVRLDESRSRDRGGFGLGLPIARALARAHGGDLFAVPQPVGTGARFRLTLPAQ